MFCSKCGKEIKNEPIVCSSCGCENHLKNNEESNESKLIGILFGIFLSFIGLIIGLFLYKENTVARQKFLKGWGISTCVVSLICIVALTVAFISFYSLMKDFNSFY
jgi:hypothetical protein